VQLQGLRGLLGGEDSGELLKIKKSSTWKQFDTVITGQELQANKCHYICIFVWQWQASFLVLCLQQKKKPVGVLSEAWKLESSTCVIFHSLVSNDKLYSLSLAKILGLDDEYSFVGIQCLEPTIYFHTLNSMTQSNLHFLTHWQSFLLVVPYLMYLPAMVLRWENPQKSELAKDEIKEFNSS